MAYDGPDTDIEAQRAAFCDNVGDVVITNHGMVALKDGLPPKDYDAVNPGSYKEQMICGDIAMEETLFNRAQCALEDAHGPSRETNHSQTFGQSAAPGHDQVAATFDLNMGPR